MYFLIKVNLDIEYRIYRVVLDSLMEVGFPQSEPLLETYSPRSGIPSGSVVFIYFVGHVTESGVR